MTSERTTNSFGELTLLCGLFESRLILDIPVREPSVRLARRTVIARPIHIAFHNRGCDPRPHLPGLKRRSSPSFRALCINVETCNAFGHNSSIRCRIRKWTEESSTGYANSLGCPRWSSVYLVRAFTVISGLARHGWLGWPC